MAMNKRTKAASESLAFFAIGAGVLIALNVLGVFLFGRLDFTSQRLFSLSEGSKRLVQQLEENLEITAYFTEDLPPPFNATERYVRDLLAEYEAASGGKLTVRFINPDSDETRQAAESDGVRRVAHQKIENDSVQVVEGYRGVAFEYLGERKTMPAVESTEGLEYEVTQIIRQLTGEKTKVGLVKGHEGPSLTEGLTTLKEVVPTYELVEVDAKETIDKSLRALLIVAPKTALSDAELRNIDAYVMGGGSLGVFGGAYTISQEQGSLSGTRNDTGLNKLLRPWGVTLGNGLVADAQCGQVPMRSNFGIPLPVPHPPVPIASFNEEQAKHPVAFRLRQTYIPFTANLQLTDDLSGEKGIERTVLSRSSERSWLLEGDSIRLDPRTPREWNSELGGKTGPFPMIVTVAGKLPSAFAKQAISSPEGGDGGGKGPKGAERASRKVHVFVAGSAGFLRDEFLPPANRNGRRDINSALALALNAIDWLAQEDALIAIRAKSVEDPVIEVPQPVALAEDKAREAANKGDQGGTEAALEERKAALSEWDARKRRYRVLNTIGMPIALIVFGLLRWQSRKRRRAEVTL